MDTSDPQIRFDQEGVCHYVEEYRKHVHSLPSEGARQEQLQRILQAIRSRTKRGEYGCIIGMSGGVDSSFLAARAHEWGLNPLIVHFDNGWNTELSVKNIESVVRHLGLDLETVVIDWDSFRRLQRAYFRASVLDLEIPTDHLIFAALHQIARRRGIRAILSGHNDATEWLLPPSWYYSKFDAANIRDIFRKHGEGKMVDIPLLGVWQQARDHHVRGIRMVQPLQLLPDYSRQSAKAELMADLGWRDYGGKHHESIFTRFYQGYILPNKFGIDKRRAHLSNAILAGAMTRDDAKKELERPPYEERLQIEDKAYVAKKLGFSDDEFDALLTQPGRAHEEYRTDKRDRLRYFALARAWGRVRRLGGWSKRDDCLMGHEGAERQ